MQFRASNPELDPVSVLLWGQHWCFILSFLFFQISNTYHDFAKFQLFVRASLNFPTWWDFQVFQTYTTVLRKKHLWTFGRCQIDSDRKGVFQKNYEYYLLKSSNFSISYLDWIANKILQKSRRKLFISFSENFFFIQGIWQRLKAWRTFFLSTAVWALCYFFLVTANSLTVQVF